MKIDKLNESKLNNDFYLIKLNDNMDFLRKYVSGHF